MTTTLVPDDRPFSLQTFDRPARVLVTHGTNGVLFVTRTFEVSSLVDAAGVRIDLLMGWHF